MPSQELPAAKKKSQDEARPDVKPELHDLKRNVKYYIGKCIGEGGFAKCYEARIASTGQVICCKTLWKAKLQRTSDKIRARTEVNIHRKMNHPNVVKFHSAMEDESYVYMFMEICRCGTLKDLLYRRKTLTEPEVRFYLLQLLSALEYFMENRVIHRDLKLANVFVTEDMTLRIGDFGLAGKLEEGQDRRTTRCGTPNYTAPEVLDQDGHSYEVDMWALGIIMYTLLLGKPPFQTKGGLREIYFKIRTVDLNFPPNAKISSEARDLVTLILRAKPEERPDFRQVRRHPFFFGFTPTSLSKETLRYPPQFANGINPAPKRTLDIDGFARPSLLPGPSTPHRKTKFGSIPQALSPAPLLKKQKFKELAIEQENIKPILPKPPIQPQQEDVPKKAIVNTNLVEEMYNIYTKAKELIAMGYSAAQIEAQIGEADLTIPNFISKWIPHEADYGFVYEFIDGTSGVLFNDLSTLGLASDKEHFELIEACNNQRLAKRYTRAEFQESNSGKMALFERFTEELNTAPPAINDTVKHASLPLSLQSPSSHQDIPHVTKVNRSKFGTFIRLSNGSIQMNLVGDHTFILSDSGRCLVAIPKKGTAIQSYSLADILVRYERASKSGRPVEGSLSALHSRLVYFLDILGNIVQRNRAKQAALSQKSPLSKQA
ncbi:Serine/threonine-protein kinase plk1 [Entomophthora muscae]|uniref:Serine/threonine-protein kinase plk1 n=2 Tax=Entomophthora muscae TaxID=34485 RepID=A0ACC2T1I3_9FUNG|nr:Serine/threonine-protein kinase plk1 [Entomophthora muscae]